jgi:hypothetical protein
MQPFREKRWKLSGFSQKPPKGYWKPTRHLLKGIGNPLGNAPPPQKKKAIGKPLGNVTGKCPNASHQPLGEEAALPSINRQNVAISIHFR